MVIALEPKKSSKSELKDVSSVLFRVGAEDKKIEVLTLALKEIGVRGAYTDEEIVNMLEVLGLKVTPTETDGILSEPKVDGNLLFKKVAKFVDPANPEQLTPATFMMVGDDGEVALRQENDVLQSFEGKKLHNQI